MGYSTSIKKAWIKHKSLLVVKLKAIENIMGFSFLLFFRTPFLTSDFLTNQEVIKSKKMTLNSGNELVYLVGLSHVGLRVVVFKEVS